MLLLKSNSIKEVGSGGSGSWMMLLLINKVDRFASPVKSGKTPLTLFEGKINYKRVSELNFRKSEKFNPSLTDLCYVSSCVTSDSIPLAIARTEYPIGVIDPIRTISSASESVSRQCTRQ